MDIGYGFDLVSRAEVDRVQDRIESASKTIIFDTAGGEVPAGDVTPLFLPHMQEEIRPYVLD